MDSMIRKRRGVLVLSTILVISTFYSFNVKACTGPGFKEWTGDVSSDWNNSSNWNGGFPSSTEHAVINPANYTGAGASPIVSAASSFRPYSLQVLNGATLTMPICKRMEIILPILQVQQLR